uniref:Uncharacterized protein n=1 Tax=Neogobius melanostomus TaxID=47308 RepID=A0A8C6SSG6_9GOBI
MFLSLVVAWIIPDVPRSLRDQLKKENMMLMEFLVDHDRQARARSPRPSPAELRQQLHPSHGQRPRHCQVIRAGRGAGGTRGVSE